MFILEIPCTNFEFVHNFISQVCLKFALSSSWCHNSKPAKTIYWSCVSRFRHMFCSRLSSMRDISMKRSCRIYEIAGFAESPVQVDGHSKHEPQGKVLDVAALTRNYHGCNKTSKGWNCLTNERTILSGLISHLKQKGTIVSISRVSQSVSRLVTPTRNNRETSKAWFN